MEHWYQSYHVISVLMNGFLLFHVSLLFSLFFRLGNQTDTLKMTARQISDPRNKLLTILLPSWKSTFFQPSKEKYISEVVRIGRNLTLITLGSGRVEIKRASAFPVSFVSWGGMKMPGTRKAELTSRFRSLSARALAMRSSSSSTFCCIWFASFCRMRSVWAWNALLRCKPINLSTVLMGQLEQQWWIKPG